MNPMSSFRKRRSNAGSASGAPPQVRIFLTDTERYPGDIVKGVVELLIDAPTQFVSFYLRLQGEEVSTSGMMFRKFRDPEVSTYVYYRQYVSLDGVTHTDLKYEEAQASKMPGFLRKDSMQRRASQRRSVTSRSGMDNELQQMRSQYDQQQQQQQQQGSADGAAQMTESDAASIMTDATMMGLQGSRLISKNGLLPGKYRYAVHVQLPTRIPPSYAVNNGMKGRAAMTYTVQAKLIVDSSTSYKDTVNLTIRQLPISRMRWIASTEEGAQDEERRTGKAIPRAPTEIRQSAGKAGRSKKNGKEARESAAEEAVEERRDEQDEEAVESPVKSAKGNRSPRKKEDGEGGEEDEDVSDNDEDAIIIEDLDGVEEERRSEETTSAGQPKNGAAPAQVDSSSEKPRHRHRRHHRRDRGEDSNGSGSGSTGGAAEDEEEEATSPLGGHVPRVSYETIIQKSKNSEDDDGDDGDDNNSKGKSNRVVRQVSKVPNADDPLANSGSIRKKVSRSGRYDPVTGAKLMPQVQRRYERVVDVSHLLHKGKMRFVISIDAALMERGKNVNVRVLVDNTKGIASTRKFNISVQTVTRCIGETDRSTVRETVVEKEVVNKVPRGSMAELDEVSLAIPAAAQLSIRTHGFWSVAKIIVKTYLNTSMMTERCFASVFGVLIIDGVDRDGLHRRCDYWTNDFRRFSLPKNMDTNEEMVRNEDDEEAPDQDEDRGLGDDKDETASTRRRSEVPSQRRHFVGRPNFIPRMVVGDHTGGLSRENGRASFTAYRDPMANPLQISANKSRPSVSSFLEEA